MIEIIADIQELSTPDPVLAEVQNDIQIGHEVLNWHTWRRQVHHPKELALVVTMANTSG